MANPVQVGTKASSTTGTAAATLPSNSTAGNLLVAMVACDTAGFSQTAPTNWLQASISSFNRNVVIFYYPNTVGGQSSFSFVTSSGGGIVAEVMELGPGDLDVKANGAASNGATATATVGSALAGGFAVALFAKGAAGETFTVPGAWTSALNLNASPLAASSAEGDYNASPGSGTVSELQTSSGTTTSWDWVIAVFKPTAIAMPQIAHGFGPN